MSFGRSSASAARSSRAHGIGLATATAGMFSINTVCARLAFDTGANAATVNAARYLFTVIMLLLVFAFGSPHSKPSPRQRLAACALGLPYFLVSFGFLGAIQYIPVSLTVLVFNCHPVLVGMTARVTERQRLSGLHIVSLLTAVLGLALALHVNASTPIDWRGVGFALLAAFGVAAMVIGSSVVMREADHVSVNLHLTATVLVMFLFNLSIEGGPRWPEVGAGWWALCTVVVTFGLGQLALVAAIGRAGPVLAAATLYLEPIMTIGLAVIVMGESLTALQLFGALLVLLSVLVISRARVAPAAVQKP